MIKRQALRIHGAEEEAKTETKSIENLSEEIIAENFQNLGKYMDIQVQEAIDPQYNDQKRTIPCHSIVKMQGL
jgi:protoporphyrinogen oxidase